MTMPTATAMAASSTSRCRSIRDYLRWYGNTDLAPNAQYYIAWIHASQGDYANAIREYDAVLEKYPDNNKTRRCDVRERHRADQMGRRTEGAREFQELIKRFPSNGLAGQSCTQLTEHGPEMPVARAAHRQGRRTRARSK